jgi:ketosteroid isomerase-like protein
VPELVLEHVHPTLLLSSPFARCIETVGPLAEAVRLPVTMRGAPPAMHTPLVSNRREEPMSLQSTDTTTDNAEVVRRGYAAFNAADIATLTELLDENVSWHTPGRSPIAGDYLGRDAVFGQFGRYGGDTGGTFKAELEQVFTSPDGRVIGLHHNSGERNGKRLDTACCIVFEVENGRMISGREYFFDLDNWDEFWS